VHTASREHINMSKHVDVLIMGPRSHPLIYRVSYHCHLATDQMTVLTLIWPDVTDVFAIIFQHLYCVPRVDGGRDCA